MIFNFRASSIKSTAGGRQTTELSDTSLMSSPLRSLSIRVASPPRPSKLKTNRSGNLTFPNIKSNKKSAAVKNIRAPARYHLSDESDADEEMIKPMPKLTQVPRPKPSLLQIPKSRLREISKPLYPIANTINVKSVPRSPSPLKAKMPRAQYNSGQVESKSSNSTPASSSLSSSDSSILEDIEPPDTLGDDSIDRLIDQDINELSRLISSGHESMRDKIPASEQFYRSPTAEDTTASLTQSTRFRKGNFSETSPISPYLSPVLEKNSLFKLQLPRRHWRAQDDDQPPPAPPSDDADDAEDSFALELLKLRESVRSQANATKAENEKVEVQAAASEPGTEINEETTANIRDVSNAIDGALLLALQPFEKRRKEYIEQDKEEAKTEAKDAPPGFNAELPLVTQVIVEQLDLTFGTMTAQRNAELKAEKDAATEARAAEEAKVKNAEAKKASDERAAKEKEMEILSLIPMRGKLLASSLDIENALLRLEIAETRVNQTVQTIAGSDSADSLKPEASLGLRLENELATLRQQTIRRIHDMEQRLQTPQEAQAKTAPVYPRTNWDRAVFEAEPSEPSENKPDDSEDDDIDQLETFHEILQRDIVQNLDLTILKLKHVLHIDAKEAAEAQEAKAREHEENAKKQLEQNRENARRKRELEDAEAARMRVMGITSLNQISSWVDEETQSHDNYFQTRAVIEHKEKTLDAWTGVLHEAADCSSFTSFFDSSRALERFDAIKEAMGQSHSNQTEHLQHLDDDALGEKHESSERSLGRYHVGHAHSPISDNLDRIPSPEAAHDKRYQRRSTNQDESDDQFKILSKRFHKSRPITRSKTQPHGLHSKSQSARVPAWPDSRHHTRQVPSEEHAKLNLTTTSQMPSRRQPHDAHNNRHYHRPEPQSTHKEQRKSSSTKSASSSGASTHFRDPHKRKTLQLRKQTQHEPMPVISRIQQQIEWFQRNRRQKDAWVKQRRPH